MVKVADLVHADDAPSTQILALLAAAVKLQEAGELARSIEILQLACVKAPEYATTHLLLGLAYIEQDDLDRAEATLRQALNINPDEDQAYQALGVLLLRKGQLEDALPALLKYLSINAMDLTTLRAVSNALRRLDRVDEAIELLQGCWQSTGTADVGIEYFRLLMKLGHTDDANTLLASIEQRYPGDPASHYERVNLALHQRDFSTAEELAIALTERYPESDRSWQTLAQVRLRRRHFNTSLESIEKSLGINARNPQSWLIKAEAAQRLGLHEESLQAARAGLACGTDEIQDVSKYTFALRMFEASSLLNLKQNEESVAQLEALRRDFPHNLAAIQLQCRILIQIDRLAEALVILQDAGNVESLEQLAPLKYEVLHRLGRPQDAWAFISPQLAESTSKRLSILAGIGIQIYTHGKVKEATEIYTQLVEFAPRDSRILCNYGFLLVGDGDYETAESILQSALAVSDDLAQETLIRSNLGYLALITGNLALAQEELERAYAIAGPGDTAIQRIAYYHDGNIDPGFTPHPTRAVPVGAAATANLVALAMVSGKPEIAELCVQQMAEEYPDDPLSEEVRGWLNYELRRIDEARQAWEKARSLSNDVQMNEVYSGWLDILIRHE